MLVADAVTGATVVGGLETPSRPDQYWGEGVAF